MFYIPPTELSEFLEEYVNYRRAKVMLCGQTVDEGQPLEQEQVC